MSTFREISTLSCSSGMSMWRGSVFAWHRHFDARSSLCSRSPRAKYNEFEVCGFTWAEHDRFWVCRDFKEKFAFQRKVNRWIPLLYYYLLYIILVQGKSLVPKVTLQHHTFLDITKDLKIFDDACTTRGGVLHLHVPSDGTLLCVCVCYLVVRILALLTHRSALFPFHFETHDSVGYCTNGKNIRTPVSECSRRL